MTHILRGDSCLYQLVPCPACGLTIEDVAQDTLDDHMNECDKWTCDLCSENPGCTYRRLKSHLLLHEIYGHANFADEKRVEHYRTPEGFLPFRLFVALVNAFRADRENLRAQNVLHKIMEMYDN
jgi:hypothetical protein